MAYTDLNQLKPRLVVRGSFLSCHTNVNTLLSLQAIFDNQVLSHNAMHVLHLCKAGAFKNISEIKTGTKKNKNIHQDFGCGS